MNYSRLFLGICLLNSCIGTAKAHQPAITKPSPRPSPTNPLVNLATTKDSPNDGFPLLAIKGNFKDAYQALRLTGPFGMMPHQDYSGVEYAPAKALEYYGEENPYISSFIYFPEGEAMSKIKHCTSDEIPVAYIYLANAGNQPPAELYLKYPNTGILAPPQVRGYFCLQKTFVATDALHLVYQADKSGLIREDKKRRELDPWHHHYFTDEFYPSHLLPNDNLEETLKGTNFLKNQKGSRSLDYVKDAQGNRKALSFETANTASNLEVSPLENPQTHEIKGYIVKYFGPVYHFCKFHCRAQGYSVVMNKEGFITDVLSSNLVYAAAEPTASKTIVDKLVQVVNNKSQLEEIFRISESPGANMTAAMSRNWMDQGGSTGMTFAYHMSIARKRLGMKDWHGADPGKQY